MDSLTDTLKDKPDSNQTSVLLPLETSFSSLRQQWKKANLPKVHPLKQELDACSKVLAALAVDVATARDKASSSSTPSSSSSDRGCCGSNSKSDLPTIDVPTFDGNIMNWASFWAAFHSTVGSREDLSDTKKLIYLRKAVKDPDTQLLLHSPSETPEMYQDIIKELKSRFDRTREIHRNLTQSLLQLTTVKQTRLDLRRLVDSVKRTIESIKATGHYNIDALLTSIVYLALPSRLQTLWEQSSKKEKGVPPVSQLLTFLREHAETLPSTQPSSGKAVEPPEKKTPRRPDKKQDYSFQKQKSHVHAMTPAPSYKWECALCKPEKHPLHICSKWLEYTVAQRLSHIQAKKLCSNCLAVGHPTSACRSTYKCRDCGQGHHTTIHQDPDVPTPVHSITGESSKVPDALMMTAQVLLQGPGGHQLQARAFMDSGAGMSLVSKRVAQLLQLPLESNTTRFSGTQATPCRASRHITHLTVSPLQDPEQQIECRAAVVQVVTDDLPPQEMVPVTEMPHLMGLQLADPTFHLPGRVDILLGADLYPQLQVKRPIVTGEVGDPAAQATIFGWAVVGPARYKHPSIEPVPAHHLQVQGPDDGLDKLVTRFWEAEEPEETEVPVSLVEEQVQTHYLNNVSYSSSSCRYKVTLPRKPDMKPLGDSRTQALSRYFANERSINRRNVWKEFQEVVQGYRHAEPVPSHQLNLPNFYLPMHSVVKQSSTSTKLRVVFDGSAVTSSGVSLNQCLLVGPTLQPTLSNILLKFRSYPIALTADISKMYQEVELAEQDKDLHRFVWRPTPHQEVQDFRMTRVTFGVSASPYLAVRTLQQTAADHGADHPQAATHIRESFYVDDLLAGAKTVEEAGELFSSLRSVLQKGGFNLCKWRSSSPAVLQDIPQELQEKIPVKDVTATHSSAHPKALGLEWDARQDCISPSINVSSSYRSTKRGIISDVSKTFDVLGWVAPAVLSMKLLYQQLWKKGHEWDSAVPEDLAEQHSKWREQLPLLALKKMTRCYSIPELPCITQELHGFSDASKKAYGAVVYLRSTYQHHPPVVSLVTAKTKVAKLEPPSVPRLELCGTVLLTKLLTNVAAVLEIPNEHVHAWTDSSIVLAWLDGQPREFKTYVANRVSFVLQATLPQTWRHVPTSQNPADCASRGMMPKDLLNHDLWWKGPDWLLQEPILVPKQPPGESWIYQKSNTSMPCCHPHQ